MPTPVLDVSEQLFFEPFADLFAAPLDEPTPPAAAEELEQQTLAHVWIIATEIKVEERIAKVADFRGSFTTNAGTRVDALEVHCRNCRAAVRGRRGERLRGPDRQPASDRRRPVPAGEAQDPRTAARCPPPGSPAAGSTGRTAPSTAASTWCLAATVWSSAAVRRPWWTSATSGRSQTCPPAPKRSGTSSPRLCSGR
ncbi:hypothetical protein [Streptomyces somaliensis]|uniref:hypothetical protein n=1 Tax=Streptomyces somaliensis TaxID=78355 RepID=UPI0034E96624|nr:hypothetical protein [Streptomyces somaliensis]